MSATITVRPDLKPGAENSSRVSCVGGMDPTIPVLTDACRVAPYQEDGSGVDPQHSDMDMGVSKQYLNPDAKCSPLP